MLEGLLGLLTFFATILLLVTGIITGAAALLTRRPQRARKIALGILAWLGLYTLALLGASLASRPRYLAPTQERCFDEMCYSLSDLKVASAPEAAPNLPPAQGRYTILTLQLRSDSRRTAQRPSQPDLFIVDAQGRRYSRMLNAGAELGLPIGQPITPAQLYPQKIQPGETVRRTLAFDLPATIRQPGLVVSEGIGPLSVILIGDENSLFHAKTEFLLNP